MKRLVAILLAVLLLPFRMLWHALGLTTLAFIAYFLIMDSSDATQVAVNPGVLHEVRYVPQNRIAFDAIGWYHAIPEHTDADPDVSACGRTMPNQIAVSRDLLRTELPCGTRVRVTLEDVGSIGEFIVWDTMSASRTHDANVLLPVGTLPTWTTERAWLTVLD